MIGVVWDAGAANTRIEGVLARVAGAAIAAGRAPTDVTVVAATKGVEPVRIAAALDAGICALGENRAQEMLQKVQDPRLQRGAPVWHFIGRLQRNKVRLLAPHVDVWESIDRADLGVELARRAPGAAVLVQINVDGGAGRGGCRPEAAAPLADHLRSLGLDVRGLMVVADPAGDPRRSFDTAAALGGSLGLPELSMGMSNDFEEAVAAGATIVRLGHALFDKR